MHKIITWTTSRTIKLSRSQTNKKIYNSVEPKSQISDILTEHWFHRIK